MKQSIDPVKARQGRNGTRILTVLVAGIALAFVAWAGADLLAPENKPLTIQPDQAVTPSSGQTTPEQ